MPPVDVAILGTGNIANIHAENLAKLGDRVRLVAAVEVDPDRLAEFGSRWGVPHLYGDLASFLATEHVDLVHLCTPPGLHREQAVACLRAGLNVLCEKPPTLSLAELDEIAAAEADSAGSFATVFQHRFGSGALSLRRLVGDPRLGRAFTAVCNTLWFRPDSYFDLPWRGTWDAEGGGPTMGHGIHQFDLLLSVLGPWEEVVAEAARQARPTDTEDLSSAIVTFASGAVATITNSLLSPRETSYLRFDFEHATVELEHLYGYDDAAWRVHPAPGHEQEVEGAWAEGPKGRPSGHAAQFAAVADALAAGQAPPVGLADARPTMELVAAVYASAFTGARVRRGDIAPGSPFYTSMRGTGPAWDSPDATTNTATTTATAGASAGGAR